MLRKQVNFHGVFSIKIYELSGQNLQNFRGHKCLKSLNNLDLTFKLFASINKM